MAYVQSQTMWSLTTRHAAGSPAAVRLFRPISMANDDAVDVRRVLMAQGGYYVATGILPFVSRRLFEAVTGPKREWWLVQTVGGLITTLGGGLLVAAVTGKAPRELLGVAGATAVTLAAIDVVYATKRRIAPTYLIDAGAELGIVAALGLSVRDPGS